MRRKPDMALQPTDTRASIAVDLGAESCRVSLLTAGTEKPHIRLVHRFPNAPITQGESLFWDLKRIMF